MTTHMYVKTKTWNPFVGCNHQCIYCVVSFQRQLKRWAKKHCLKCYNYTPHYNPARLKRIPSAEIIFVCGDGDIAFCSTSFLTIMIHRLWNHSIQCPYKTYYFQSKDWNSVLHKGRLDINDILPVSFKQAIILETLETNRDEGYERISKAPKPTIRHNFFQEINYPRKVITIEPILDFDISPFFKMITDTEPEYVWIGYNSKPNLVKLPEPSLEKTKQLMKLLKASGIEVRGKSLRGITI